MKGRAWEEQFKQTLNQQHGEKKGSAFFKKYREAFDRLYCEEYPVERAVQDLHFLEKSSAENFIELNFYYSADPEKTLHLRIYKWNQFIPLADILPILNDFDFRAWRESTHRIQIGTEK